MGCCSVVVMDIRVGNGIDFLAQLEDFQKKLWLKKKFVVETNWCITLDRIPETFYPEIAANAAQREEWVRLFAIDEIKAGQGDLFAPSVPGYSVPLTVAFLKGNDKLVLDTAFFPPEFRDRLVAGIEDLEERTDGLLIHSDNSQALALLQSRYRNDVSGIFVDPPYNTGVDGFPYKDNFQHSSWLTMMEERFRLGLPLLQLKGISFCTIDFVEVSVLRLLFDRIYGAGNFLADIAWEKRYTRSNNAKRFYSLKDTILCYRNSVSLEHVKEARTEKSKENYSNPDNDPRGDWISSSYVNPATKEERPNLAYPLFNPFTRVWVEHPTHAWKYDPKTHAEHVASDRLY
ncbi:MAG: site-specific DNA-methyltransferase, partial [Spirochaetia bacterium]|nr:site-specific DNA-methyltransferase [Spirochaetia bacterium]